MFGKAFASMYDGSLYGAGAIVFAVWGYVIACQEPSRLHGSVVTLNAKKLADTIGEDEESVGKAIEFLCAPDANSTTKEEQGRRLIRLGEFEYRVVNGAKYRAIRDREMRRAQLREAQDRHRAKVKPVAGHAMAEAVVDREAELPSELPSQAEVEAATAPKVQLVPAGPGPVPAWAQWKED